MMTSEQRLQQIQALLKTNQVSSADQLLRNTLEDLSHLELKTVEHHLRALIQCFAPKRRRNLTGALNNALSGIFDFNHSRRIERMIEGSRSTCCWRCLQTISAEDLQNHIAKTCPARFRTCKSCKRTDSIEEIEKHAALGCPTPCTACKILVPQPQLWRHRYKDCPVLTRLCAHCRRRVPASSWDQHQREHDNYWDSQSSGSSLLASSGGLPSLGKRR